MNRRIMSVACNLVFILIVIVVIGAIGFTLNQVTESKDIAIMNQKAASYERRLEAHRARYRDREQ